jgi:hypothetical protein
MGVKSELRHKNSCLATFLEKSLKILSPLSITIVEAALTYVIGNKPRQRKNTSKVFNWVSAAVFGKVDTSTRQANKSLRRS